MPNMPPPGRFSPHSAFLNGSNRDKINPNWLETVHGCVGDVAKKSRGSRQLQLHLPNASPTVRHLVIEEVVEEVIPLSKNVFAKWVTQNLWFSFLIFFFSFVVQAVLPMMDRMQLNNVIDVFSGKVLSMSFDPHGCRVLKSLIAFFPNVPRILSLAEELIGYEKNCAFDTNAVHVLQQIIRLVRK
jgi:hypothetical protein